MALPYGYPKIPSASLLPQPIDDVTSFEAYGGPNAEAGDASALSQLEHRLRTDVQHSGQLFRRVYQASVRHAKGDSSAQVGHRDTVLREGNESQTQAYGVRVFLPRGSFYFFVPVATQPAVPFSLKNPVGWPTFTRVSVAKSESSMRDGSEGGHFAISA
jgi:hypothetical protein